jgi:multiple sugar transport system substrate-binding protein
MQNINRRKFLELAVGTTAAAILASCSPAVSQTQAAGETEAPTSVPPEADKFELEFWNGIGPPEGVMMEEFMKRWQEENPNVNLTQWTTDWDAFYTKLKIAVSQGTLPDFAMLHPWRIAAYADTPFKPIDNLLDAQSVITADMFQESLWKAIQYNGKQYGFPMDNFLLALYYNVDLLEKANGTPPNSDEDLVQYSKALTSAPQEWGFTYGSMVTWDFSAFLAHEGQKGYVSEDGTKATINNEAGHKALQLMYDNIYKDKITPSPVEGIDTYQLFMDGKNAFRLGGTWEKFGFDNVEGLNYKSILFTPGAPGTWGGSHDFVFTMANGDQRDKAAWDAATWVVTNFDAEWGIRAGHIPALKKAAQDPEYLAATENMPGHRDSVPYMVGLPKIAKLDDVEEVMSNSLNEVFQNAKQPTQALEEAEAKINAILMG